MKEQNNDNVPDRIAAINAWQDYNKNNNSVVVDLFQVCFMIYHVLLNSYPDHFPRTRDGYLLVKILNRLAFGCQFPRLEAFAFKVTGNEHFLSARPVGFRQKKPTPEHLCKEVLLTPGLPGGSKGSNGTRHYFRACSYGESFSGIFPLHRENSSAEISPHIALPHKISEAFT